MADLQAWCRDRPFLWLDASIWVNGTSLIISLHSETRSLWVSSHVIYSSSRLFWVASYIWLHDFQRGQYFYNFFHMEWPWCNSPWQPKISILREGWRCQVWTWRRRNRAVTGCSRYETWKEYQPQSMKLEKYRIWSQLKYKCEVEI